MNTTLLSALTTLFDASEAYADVSAAGGLWVAGVPEDKTALPYVVLEHGGEVPSWDAEGQVLRLTGSFAFVVYAAGLANAEALAADIMAALDPRGDAGEFVKLPIADTVEAHVERQDYRVALVPERDRGGNWVYEVRLPYKSFVSRLVQG